MAATHQLFNCFPEYLLRSTIDCDNDGFKFMLLTSAYTPNLSTHVALADVSAFEIANGFGYLTGGVAVTPTVARVGAVSTVNLPDAVWVATGGNIPAFHWGVWYANVTRNGIVNPLGGLVLADATPADIPATISGATLRLAINPAGLFTS